MQTLSHLTTHGTLSTVSEQPEEHATKIKTTKISQETIHTMCLTDYQNMLNELTAHCNDSIDLTIAESKMIVLHYYWL